MRVDLAQIPGQGGLKVRPGAGSFVASLKEGDSIKAEVLSSDRGAVIMKAEGGQTFKARLDSDVTLSPGDSVLLEMVGKEAGIVTLSIREERPAVGETAGQTGNARGFEDETLLPYADKLAELNMPVTEENARLIRELSAQNPGISMDEAAFIAANKLTGDESLIMAALSMLSDGEKTDAMLERLLSLLQNSEFGIRNSEFGINNENTDVGQIAANETNSAEEFGIQNSESGINNENTEVGQIAAGETNSAEEFGIWNSEFGINNENADTGQIATNMSDITGRDANIAPLASEVAESSILEESPNSEFRIPNSEFIQKPETLSEWLSPVLKGIIPHNDSIMQSRIPTNSAEISQGAEIPRDDVSSLEKSVVKAENPGIRPEDASKTEAIITNRTDAPEESAERIKAAGRAIAELLSELEEFKGAPAPALERFSGMLLRIAGGSAGTSDDGIDKLTNLLNNAFTRIEKNDRDAGMRIKNAKEELFARLTMLEESISRASPPEKTLMLEQTRRLMDHIRLLNNINQFAYLQLPVQVSGERKTAELYVFKKKGGKRLDAENVNILLALDLENMGHWEGLINFRNKDVSIRMQVQGPKEKEYFSENTVMLHELLAEAGFKLVNTDIIQSVDETTPLTALSVFDRLTKSRAGGIDFIV